jgi:S-phase kinase-associated protein 1
MNTIKNMINDSSEIIFTDITDNDFDKIIEFSAKYLLDIENPTIGWSKQFFCNLSDDEIIKVINSAYYLQHIVLLEHCSKYIIENKKIFKNIREHLSEPIFNHIRNIQRENNVKISILKDETGEEDMEIIVPLYIYNQMKTIKTTANDLEGDTVIPAIFPELTEKIYAKITEFSEKYSEEPDFNKKNEDDDDDYDYDYDYDENPNKKRELSDWDKDFFAKALEHYDDRNALMNSANFLNHERLIEYGAQYIAEFMIKDLTVEQMRDFFGVVNDFTPEEEQAIKEQHAWIDK